jgi:hypothetical protein
VTTARIWLAGLLVTGAFKISARIKMKIRNSFHNPNPGDRIFPNVARLFFALWYLLGSLVHIKAGLTDNQVYEVFGRTSLLAASRQLWTSVIMPHITFFALLLAAFEMATGILILSKGRYVRIGLTASVVFNLFLVQLGLGYPATLWSLRDFLQNRLINLLFALLQCPLLWVHFSRSLPALLRARLR